MTNTVTDNNTATKNTDTTTADKNTTANDPYRLNTFKHFQTFFITLILLSLAKCYVFNYVGNSNLYTRNDKYFNTTAGNANRTFGFLMRDMGTQPNKNVYLELFRVFLAFRLVEFQFFWGHFENEYRVFLKLNSCRFLKGFKGSFFK